MSEQNVEIVREIYSGWRKGFAKHLDPEVEWVNPPDAIEPGVRRGIEAFSSAAATVSETFKGAHVEFEEFIDAGDQVVVFGKLRGHGRGSGAEIEQEQGYVWTLRNGKAIRFEWFNDQAQALAAAGLEARPGGTA